MSDRPPRRAGVEALAALRGSSCSSTSPCSSGLPVGYLFIKAFSPGLGRVLARGHPARLVSARSSCRRRSPRSSSRSTPSSASAPRCCSRGAVRRAPAARPHLRHPHRRLADHHRRRAVLRLRRADRLVRPVAAARRASWSSSRPLGIALASMAVSLPYVLRSVAPGARRGRRGARRRPRARSARDRGGASSRSRCPRSAGACSTASRSRSPARSASSAPSSSSRATSRARPRRSRSTSTTPWDQNYDALGVLAGAVVLASISIAALVVLSILRSEGAETACRYRLTRSPSASGWPSGSKTSPPRSPRAR